MGFREMRGGEGVSDVEIRRNEIIELLYGTKFCSHSPSIPEEELHQAILKAVQNLAANFTDEVAAQLDGILRQMKAG